MLNSLINNIKKFFRQVPSSPLVVSREILTAEDHGRRLEFLASEECKTIEKFLRARIMDRIETAIDGTISERERLDVIAKKEELRDILEEWKNIRIDTMQDNDAA